MEEAEALSDRVAIMRDGRLLLCDTAENIKRAAQTDNFEQAFIRIVKGVAL
jgi:ABC-type Na+ transport system ATPase subunit NatA